jgi:hypothetical protein
MKAKTNTLLMVVSLLAYWIGLCNASAFYDPGAQRWLNRDTIAEKGGINLFEFVGNNSILAFDPYGKNPVIVVGGVVITITALDAAAAAAGLTIYGCLMSPPCRAAAWTLMKRSAMCAAAAAECVASPWCGANPTYGRPKPCAECFRECMNDGAWPYYKCPQ